MSEDRKVKPKLLVVTTTFPRWEYDTDPPFVFELSKRMVDKFNVTVHTPHYSGSKVHENLCGMSICRFRYFMERYEKIAGETAILPFLKNNKSYFLILPFFLFFQLITLIFLTRRIRPDIIHVHWLFPTGLLAVITSLLTGKIPVVVTCHGSDVFALQSTFFTWLKKWTLHHVNNISVVSSNLKKEVNSLSNSWNRTVVIPMGVDSTKFNSSNYSENIIKTLNIDGTFLLFVGRLTETKGVRLLLDAIKRLKENKLTVTLVVIGEGEQRTFLEKYCEKLKISDCVRFKGAISNQLLPEYYASSDIFIGPSIDIKGVGSEGFGLTFVEAALSGSLMIGSATGGITDIIKHKQTGLLTKPGSVEDLERKIVWALQHPVEMAEISEEGRKQCGKYDWTIIVKNYENLYRQAIPN